MKIHRAFCSESWIP